LDQEVHLVSLELKETEVTPVLLALKVNLVKKV